jgi:hypothetical protein
VSSILNENEYLNAIQKLIYKYNSKYIIQDITKTGYKVSEGSAAPNTHHYNLAHTRKWRPNQTLVRERGYGLGTHYSKVGENAFYTQPGHIMNPTYKPNKSNKDTVFLTPEFLISIEDQYGPEKMAAVIEKDWRTFAEKRRQMNLAAAAANK